MPEYRFHAEDSINDHVPSNEDINEIRYTGDWQYVLTEEATEIQEVDEAEGAATTADDGGTDTQNDGTQEVPPGQEETASIVSDDTAEPVEGEAQTMSEPVDASAEQETVEAVDAEEETSGAGATTEDRTGTEEEQIEGAVDETATQEENTSDEGGTAEDSPTEETASADTAEASEEGTTEAAPEEQTADTGGFTTQDVENADYTELRSMASEFDDINGNYSEERLRRELTQKATDYE